MTGAAAKCEQCGFWLYNPVASTSLVDVGLYDDDRYPGRCLVVWHDHVEHLDELGADDLLRFWGAVQQVTRCLKSVLGVSRVNVAVLGNREPHLHAHVVPRGGPKDVVQDQAPWAHPDPAQPMDAGALAELMGSLRIALAGRLTE